MCLFLCLIINIIVYSNFMGGFFWVVFPSQRCVAPSKAFRRRRTRTPCCVFGHAAAPRISSVNAVAYLHVLATSSPTTPPPTLLPATNVRCCWSQVAPAHCGFSILGRYFGDRRGAGVAAVVGGGGKGCVGGGGGRG